jgi:hypothetical protein
MYAIKCGLFAKQTEHDFSSPSLPPYNYEPIEVCGSAKAKAYPGVKWAE